MARRRTRSQSPAAADKLYEDQQTESFFYAGRELIDLNVRDLERVLRSNIRCTFARETSDAAIELASKLPTETRHNKKGYVDYVRREIERVRSIEDISTRTRLRDCEEDWRLAFGTSRNVEDDFRPMSRPPSSAYASGGSSQLGDDVQGARSTTHKLPPGGRASGMRSNRHEEVEKWTSNLEDWQRAQHQKRRVHRLLAEQQVQQGRPPRRPDTNVRGRVSSCEEQFPDWLYPEPPLPGVMPHSASPSSARKMAPQRTSRMGEPWSAPGASSNINASARVRGLDDALWNDSRAGPMSATSTGHDNDFAVAVALEDLEDKHDPFEWLRSPIKLTPLEKSNRLARTMHADKRYTRDLDSVEQRSTLDGRRRKVSSRQAGRTAEDHRKPAYNPGTSNDSFLRRMVEEPASSGGSFARGKLPSCVEDDNGRLPKWWKTSPERSIGRANVGGGGPESLKGGSSHYTEKGRGWRNPSSGRPRYEDTSSPSNEGSDVDDNSHTAIPESLLKNGGFREDIFTRSVVERLKVVPDPDAPLKDYAQLWHLFEILAAGAPPGVTKGDLLAWTGFRAKYYAYRSMCSEIESCGGVADCLTSSSSARHFRSPNIFTGRKNTRHRIRGPKWGTHEFSPSRGECPCLENDQERSKQENRRQSDSHDGSTSSGVSWRSPPARYRGRPGTPDSAVIDLVTPPSPSLQRVERNDESPRNVETRAGLSAWQHSTASSIDIPSTARASQDANQLESCDICRCSMAPDSDIFTFKCGKSGIAAHHKYHFACIAPYWERCQARTLPLSADLVECPKCRRRQCVTSDEREGFHARLAERRLRQKRIAKIKLNRSNRDNPVDVSDSPAPAPAEASSSDAWLRSALPSRVESGGWESDGDSASPSATAAPNAKNSTSGVDVLADSNRAASPPTAAPPPNQGRGSVSSPGSPPFLASSADLARERARTETALRAAAFVRSFEDSVEGRQSHGGDSALNAQIAASDSATTGHDAENVHVSAGSHGSGSERDFDLS